MARIDRPTTDQPTLPLENIEQTEIRITNENLDDALRILRQVLEEAKTNDDNSPESFLVDYDLPSDSRRHGFYRRARLPWT